VAHAENEFLRPHIRPRFRGLIEQWDEDVVPSREKRLLPR